MRKLWDDCEQGKHRAEKRRVGIKILQGRLWEQGKILVPQELHASVVQALHCHVHPGVQKTLQLIMRRYDFKISPPPTN